jgi:hypothetical protein
MISVDDVLSAARGFLSFLVVMVLPPVLMAL